MSAAVSDGHDDENHFIVRDDPCPLCMAPKSLTVSRPANGDMVYECANGCDPARLSAQFVVERDKAPVLRFLTPAELRAITPPEVTWVWDGYLAAGAVALLVGKPKAGKSTLALAACDAVSGGGVSFLDRAVGPGGVVYVSEEGVGTLAHKLPAGEVDLHVLTRDAAWPKPEWKNLVTQAVAHATKVDAVLLVIDTAAYWTALAADKEKDAGAVQAAMLPLVEATRSGLAVLLVHHARKAGGEDGDAVRGSSGWAGSVDTIIELERPAGEKVPPNQRLLIARGRYPQTPAVLLIDHDPATGAWGVIGAPASRQDVRDESERAVVVGALAGGELTRAQLEDITQRSWLDLSSVVNKLLKGGLIERTGPGKSGKPYRYRMSVQEPATQTYTAATDSGGGAAGCVSVYPVGGHTQPAPPSRGSVSVEHTDHGTADGAAVIDAFIAAFDAVEVDTLPERRITWDLTHSNGNASL